MRVYQVVCDHESAAKPVVNANLNMLVEVVCKMGGWDPVTRLTIGGLGDRDATTGSVLK